MCTMAMARLERPGPICSPKMRGSPCSDWRVVEPARVDRDVVPVVHRVDGSRVSAARVPCRGDSRNGRIGIFGSPELFEATSRRLCPGEGHQTGDDRDQRSGKRAGFPRHRAAPISSCDYSIRSGAPRHEQSRCLSRNAGENPDDGTEPFPRSGEDDVGLTEGERKGQRPVCKTDTIGRTADERPCKVATALLFAPPAT